MWDKNDMYMLYVFNMAFYLDSILWTHFLNQVLLFLSIVFLYISI